jgi:riboflavin kinase/FMN adenylyltransferase
METVFGLRKAGRRASPVATIGVFDGVHRGHRVVLEQTAGWARELGGTAMVITFDRHPERVLKGRSPESITSLEHRLHLIAQTRIEVCVVLHFDSALANMEAADFARNVLAQTVGVRGVVLGYNARFGRGGGGTAALLEEMGASLGFQVRTVPPLEVDSAPVSSTRIRRLIETGRLDSAAALLGRPFALRGTVMHGRKRGKSLGFPTANLNLHHEVTPPRGVYICRAGLAGGVLWGLVNIGIRPTFSKEGEPPTKVVEVYLDGYDGGGLYGETLEVEIVTFLRPEIRFADARELAGRIEQDRRILETFKRELGQARKSS